MLIRKAFQFKLKPTPEQEETFVRYAGACRWVWNHMLGEWNAQYAETHTRPTLNHQMHRLTLLKYEEGNEWLQEINAQVLQQPVRFLHQAWGRFFEGTKKPPRFKSKRRDPLRFTIPQHVRVEGKQVYLPKIGWVRFWKSRELEGTLKGATVRKKASGWYIALHLEVEVADPVLPPLDEARIIGLDLGLREFAVLSTGERIPAPRLLRKSEKKLAKAQHKLDRMQRGSQRYQKQKRKVGLLYEKVANQRREFHHQLSHRLTTENQGVIVENLSVKGLARTRMAKSVLDAGWGQFVRQLEYKSQWRGVYFCKVERFYPSTKLHRACGTLNQVALHEREFVCQGCGALVDRDLNAAENILARGVERLTGASE